LLSPGRAACALYIVRAGKPRRFADVLHVFAQATGRRATC
jgi:hypothetical protein